MLLPSTRPVSPIRQQLFNLSARPSQAQQKRNICCRPNRPDGAIINEEMAFPSFRMLPPEVRIKIWRAALLPRLITITPRFNREVSTCEVEVKARPVDLLHVCQESRAEALRNYSQIKFNNDHGVTSFINWARDTIFLDLLDESLDINDTVAFLGATFRSVQVLAIRMKTHVFWGFRDILKEASHLEQLIFVDESERRHVTPDVFGFLYFLDLGSLGFAGGYHTDPSREYQYFQKEVCIRLVECHPNEEFEARQWEMSPDAISWVKRLNLSGERYCLLFPIT